MNEKSVTHYENLSGRAGCGCSSFNLTDNIKDVSCVKCLARWRKYKKRLDAEIYISKFTVGEVKYQIGLNDEKRNETPISLLMDKEEQMENDK